MDRKQVIVERAREVFGERIDDVVHMVRQDRQGLRGWEEPAHVRAVLRRGQREAEGAADNGSSFVTTLTESARCAGEPEPGQQREAVGFLLEAGATALQKVGHHGTPDLNAEERLGLECVLLMYGRPSILVGGGRLAHVPAFWNVLEDCRQDVELAQAGVGRVEMYGHPEYDWAGTGFLVNETTLLTTRRVAEQFAECAGTHWQFRPGITCWMDYRSECDRPASAGYRVRGVLGCHEHYDVALLEVEPPHQHQGQAPTPLVLAAEPPAHVPGRPVYLIGYPVCDTRRSEPEAITRIFRDVYNVKRVQPGRLHGTFAFNEVQLMHHDCGSLGQCAGGCVVDLETHQVIGLHLSGRYLEKGTAVPLWALRDDPLFQRAAVTFAQATPTDVQSTAHMIERLARSRYWGEARQFITTLYQRAFGTGYQTHR